MGAGSAIFPMIKAIKAFNMGSRVKEFKLEDWLACADFAELDEELRDLDGRPNATLRQGLIDYFKESK